MVESIVSLFDGRIGWKFAKQGKKLFVVVRRKIIFLSLKPVVQSISATIPAGTVAAIVGLSSSGKKTLAQLIGHELKPTNGTIQYRSNNTKNSIMYIDEDTPLIGTLSVYETIYFAIRMCHSAVYEHSSNDDLVRNHMMAVQLETLESVAVEHLSTSERMRLKLAVALATSPRVIVIDGLTNCISAGEENAMFKLLRELALNNKVRTLCYKEKLQKCVFFWDWQVYHCIDHPPCRFTLDELFSIRRALGLWTSFVCWTHVDAE